jgi:hypothetical protein
MVGIDNMNAVPMKKEKTARLATVAWPVAARMPSAPAPTAASTGDTGGLPWRSGLSGALPTRLARRDLPEYEARSLQRVTELVLVQQAGSVVGQGALAGEDDLLEDFVLAHRSERGAGVLAERQPGLSTSAASAAVAGSGSTPSSVSMSRHAVSARFAAGRSPVARWAATSAR